MAEYTNDRIQTLLTEAGLPSLEGPRFDPNRHEYGLFCSRQSLAIEALELHLGTKYVGRQRPQLGARLAAVEGQVRVQRALDATG